MSHGPVINALNFHISSGKRNRTMDHYKFSWENSRNVGYLFNKPLMFHGHLSKSMGLAEQVVVMENGCMCCTVPRKNSSCRGDVVLGTSIDVVEDVNLIQRL